jgi:hypothetical protein
MASPLTNGIGRRTATTDLAGSEAWSYDQLGRVPFDKRVTNALSKTISYTYNLDGSFSTLAVPTYPDGSHALTSYFTQGAAGRPTALSINGGNSYPNVHYTPAGQQRSSQLNWGHNFYTTSFFNNRLQPTMIYDLYDDNAGTVTPPPPCALSSPIPNGTYNHNELYLTYNFVDSNGHNNGNVISISNGLDATRSQLFTYDSLNRILTAQTQTTGVTMPNASCWGLTFGYFTLRRRDR